MTATTSRTTKACTRATARARTSGRSSTPRTRAICASSPSSSSTTPRTSTRGFRRRAGRNPARANATSTCGATPTRSTPGSASFSATRSDRTGRGIRSRTSTTGTGFFHHQPDLNFDNPQVRKAVARVMRFWLDQGVDGMRLDAVPYLIEREGTSCANLPETHDVLRGLRRELDARYSNRMLLAEANLWPSDVAAYFGDGDECHMAFHFPLMPRLFMALRQEDRHPISEILYQTPDIPATCQWAIFLRNHDELTLEMVTDEERDYMYQTYAADPQMRVNAGIRRRLAPLMENSRRRIELHARAAALAAGHARHLLRRRNRDGRQRLPRRSQRRADADAVDGGSQRRLLARGSGAAVRAADHGSGLRLPVGQRRSAGTIALLAAQLVAPHHRVAAAASDIRPRRARAPPPGQPAHLRVHSPARHRRPDPRRRQPRSDDAAGDTGLDEVRRTRAGRDVRQHRAAAHLREPVLPDDGTVRVLLAGAEAPAGGAAHRAAHGRRQRERTASVAAARGSGLGAHARGRDAADSSSARILRRSCAASRGSSAAATSSRPGLSTGPC